MKRNIASWVQVILFTAFIGFFFIINLILPDKEMSEVENRYLQQLPSFSVDDLESGKFTSDFEKYTNDQFFMRDQWITIKAATELASGKKENNDVYYCEGGTLIERFTSPDDDTLKQKVEYVNALNDKLDVPVYFAIIPGAAEIWRDKLPANAPCDSQKELIDKVYSWSEAENVDMYGALAPHAGEYIFYRTDHHWTSRGAYYGYTALMDAMGMEANPISNYDVKDVSDSFLGTVYSTSGFTWVKPDSIQTFVDPYDGLEITNYPQGKPIDGMMYDTLYLDKKDKYSMFFGGITPLLEIDTGNEGLPSLLIIRDSYTDSLTPFLLEHFSEIDIIDLRYNNTDISQYIEEHDIDSVLVCYSAYNFSIDTNLYKLAR